jgi:hypothetical protein
MKTKRKSNPNTIPITNLINITYLITQKKKFKKKSFNIYWMISILLVSQLLTFS